MAIQETAAAICGAASPAPIAGGFQTTCKREPGHFGAHADEDVTWSAAPPLGPVPERFRRKPLEPDASDRQVLDEVAARLRGAAVTPSRTPEVLVAGLVACGRALGRIEHELGQRKHWQAVLSTAARMLPPDRLQEPQENEWARVGKHLFGLVTATAEAPQSEPDGPIRERAEALAVLLLQGTRYSGTPNVLIRAGVALDVVRSAWRKAMAGQS